MAKLIVSPGLNSHVSDTVAILQEIAIQGCNTLPEALPGLRDRLSQSRLEPQHIHCDGLENLHDAVEAINKLNLMIKLANSDTISHGNRARAIMDVLELKHKRSVYTMGSGHAPGEDISLAHLAHTHEDEFKRLIQECIRQSAHLERRELQDRFNAIFQDELPLPPMG